MAYKLGCKGITVYRDGSRQEQVLNITKKDSKEIFQEQNLLKISAEVKKEEMQSAKKEEITQSAFVSENKIEPRPRPEITTGTTTKVLTGCGNLYVTINNDTEGRPFEVFTQMGKAGGCAASQLEAISRLASLAFRSGIDQKAIIEQLRGIRCPVPSWDKGERIFSCADAISRVLEKRFRDHSLAQTPQKVGALVLEENDSKPSVTHGGRIANMIGVCPDCGSPLNHEEGCLKCYGCGYSRC